MPLKSIAKRVLTPVAKAVGIRRLSDNYGVEAQEHLGGYWPGGDPNTYCPELWSSLVAEWKITSVLDVGCGQGISTKYFHDLGLRVLGVEGGKNALRTSPVPHLIHRHDYTEGPYVPDAPFDLVWCCEFVEHVEERYVSNFLASFASGQYCVLTHAFPNQEGFHHVNCRTAEYWIDKLESIEFTFEQAITERLRDITTAMNVKRSLLLFSTRRHTGREESRLVDGIDHSRVMRCVELDRHTPTAPASRARCTS